MTFDERKRNDLSDNRSLEFSQTGLFRAHRHDQGETGWAGAGHFRNAEGQFSFPRRRFFWRASELTIRDLIGSVNTSAFVGTNPTDELITSRFPVTRELFGDP